MRCQLCDRSLDWGLATDSEYCPQCAPPVGADIPEGTKCQEALAFSRGGYRACAAPAVAIINNGDSRPYYMCVSCADHNITNRGGKLVILKNQLLLDKETVALLLSRWGKYGVTLGRE